MIKDDEVEGEWEDQVEEGMRNGEEHEQEENEKKINYTLSFSVPKPCS